jgi:hypothetical protein
LNNRARQARGFLSRPDARDASPTVKDIRDDQEVDFGRPAGGLQPRRARMGCRPEQGAARALGMEVGAAIWAASNRPGAEARVVPDSAQMANCACDMMKTSAADCMKSMHGGHMSLRPAEPRIPADKIEQ